MSEVATVSPELRAILDAAEQRIQETGGIPHDEFWRQVDVEYDAAPNSSRLCIPTAESFAPYVGTGIL
jgi:hypothetical protein